LDDLRNPVRRHLELTRKLGWSHRRFGKLFGENFSGMDRRARHDQKLLVKGAVTLRILAAVALRLVLP
jgi:hypothetical protein